MGADDELKPLVKNGVDYWRLALLVGLAGGTYILGTIPLVLGVITQEKVSQSSTGFSQEAISKGQSFLWIGWAVSSAFILPCVDRLGRKLPYICMLAVGLAFTFVSTRAHTVFLFALAAFFIGASLPPSGTVGYLLIQESIPKSMWSFATVTMNVLYSCTSILVTVVGGTAARDLTWRTETLLWHVPFVAVLLLAPVCLSESPDFQKEARDRDAGASEPQGKSGPLAQLFCTPALLGRLGATVSCWVACTVGFYGLSYCSGNISSGFYTNLALLALVDIISYGLAGTIINSRGARSSQFLAFVMAGLSMVVGAIVPSGLWRTIACLCGRFMLDVAFTTIFVLLLETFPVECRGSAAGVANACARLTGMCTPLFGTMRMASVGAIMFVLCTVAAVSTRTLPADAPVGPASDVERSD